MLGQIYKVRRVYTEFLVQDGARGLELWSGVGGACHASLVPIPTFNNNDLASFWERQTGKDERLTPPFQLLPDRVARLMELVKPNLITTISIRLGLFTLLISPKNQGGSIFQSMAPPIRASGVDGNDYIFFSIKVPELSGFNFHSHLRRVLEPKSETDQQHLMSFIAPIISRACRPQLAKFL
jgi:hypothetical protein